MGLSAAKGVAVRKGWFSSQRLWSPSSLPRHRGHHGRMEAFCRGYARPPRSGQRPPSIPRRPSRPACLQPASPGRPVADPCPSSSRGLSGLPLPAIEACGSRLQKARELSTRNCPSTSGEARPRLTPASASWRGARRMSAGERAGSGRRFGRKSVIMRGIKLDDAALSPHGPPHPAVK
jgi:hypothetical protein